MAKGEVQVQQPSNSVGNRRCAVLLPLGLLMLSMAVFGWGLQYKLSLYKSRDSISHLAPVAKLLSQKERVTAPTPGPSEAPPFFPFVLVAALALGLSQVAAQYLRSRVDEDGWPPLACWLPVMFVRPPPLPILV